MTFKIDETTTSLIAVLGATTQQLIGDNEMPTPLPNEEQAYIIVATIPGGSTSGGMASGSEMATAVYQLMIVGHSNDQCRKLQQLVHECLDGAWGLIAGCMGPARTVLGGIVKEDEQTFVATDTLYMEIT
jgi:hypothetical protein